MRDPEARFTTHELEFGVNHRTHAEIDRVIQEVIRDYEGGDEDLFVDDLTVVSEATAVSDVWHARVTCRVTRVYEETPNA